ncbi:MAG: ATP-binding protein, partial [Conexibacter sp.]
AGIGPARRRDLVLAVNELATNSIRHGGGEGALQLWEEDDALVCEVRDHGHVADPLAGRARPSGRRSGGHGLWLVHRLCDLVELRTQPAGTVVRVRVLRSPA